MYFSPSPLQLPFLATIHQPVHYNNSNDFFTNLPASAVTSTIHFLQGIQNNFTENEIRSYYSWRKKKLQQLIIKLKIKFNLLILAYKFHSLHDLHPPASQIYPMPPSPLPTLLWPHKYTKILPIKEFSYTT